MEIVLEIKADKKSAMEMQSKIDAGEKVVIGEPIPEGLQKLMEQSVKLEAKEDSVRERVLKIRYLPSQAKLIGKFFKENNIQFEFLDK